MKTQKINKLFTLVAFFMAALTVSSCKKYLDQQPITSVGPEFVFKDVNTTYQAIIGVYSRMVGDAGYGIRLSLYYPLDTDEMQVRQVHQTMIEETWQDTKQLLPMHKLNVHLISYLQVSNMQMFVLTIYLRWDFIQVVQIKKKRNCKRNTKTITKQN